MLASILALMHSPTGAVESRLTIDAFNYSSSVAAAAAWQPGAGASPVLISSSGAWGRDRVMVLPIRYDPESDRRYWDRSVSLDLSAPANVSLEVFVGDPGPVSYLTLYFHSPPGWTAASVTVSRPGWQVWTWGKEDFRNEGESFDWSRIDRIRISPWKNSEGETLLALRDLSTSSPDILIVEGDRSSDRRGARNAAELIDSIFSGWRLPSGMTTDTGVERGGLAAASVAVFPYNDAMSETELAEIERFVRRGGKIIAFYNLTDTLADLLGLRDVGWTRQTYPGQFSAYRFEDTGISGLPEEVLQHSWNIRIVEPAPGGARVIARWEDASGKELPYPAWLASATGAFMSHILRSDDLAAKELMMLALVGHYRPESWSEAAAAAFDRVAQVGDHLDYESVVSSIRDSVEGSGDPTAAERCLRRAEAMREKALSYAQARRHREAVLAAVDARKALLEAYCLVQSPKRGEWRAFWEHSGCGAFPGDWDRSARNLAENGFTAVIPNMMNGGSADFDSAFLPHSRDCEVHGDQVAQCVAAARQYGLEVHVWKVNFNFSWDSPPNWIQSMRAAGRTQVDIRGDPIDWLCPSHPENFALERDSMLEVAEKYAIDGIHFDYIRYPNDDFCYCDGCRRRFEEGTGLSVPNWPLDCSSGPLASAYRDWRASRITRLVEAVASAAHGIRPDLRVSAAVFSNYPSCRRSVGQDWPHWVRSGYLDFVCPMDYTSDFERFRKLVSAQMEMVGGQIALYPGIGASSSSSSLGPDGIIAQILTARALGTPGFVIFQYDRSMADLILPELGKGITSPAE